MEEFDFDKLQPNALLLSDWSAMYFQLTVEHALRYASDKSSPSGIVCLVRFELGSEIKVTRLTDEIFSRSDIGGLEKAEHAKKILGISQKKLLMPSLSEALILSDNPEDQELILPWNLVNSNHLTYTNIMQFQIYNYYLQKWRLYGSIEWTPLTTSEKMNPQRLVSHLSY